MSAIAASEKFIYLDLIPPVLSDRDNRDAVMGDQLISLTTDWQLFPGT